MSRKLLGGVLLAAVGAPVLLLGAQVIAAVLFRGCPESRVFWAAAGIYLALSLCVLLIAQAGLRFPARGLIILGAFFLLLAVFAFPNLYGGTDRGKQRRTMSALRSIGAAVEAYEAEHRAYPAVDDIEDLARLVEPAYIISLPRLDGWGFPLQFRSDGAEYWIASYGACGVADVQDPSAYVPGKTTDFTADIVYANGVFFVYPEGSQN